MATVVAVAAFRPAVLLAMASVNSSTCWLPPFGLTRRMRVLSPTTSRFFSSMVRWRTLASSLL
jgi:hypothetical protein